MKPLRAPDSYFGRPAHEKPRFTSAHLGAAALVGMALGLILGVMLAAR